MDIFFRQYNRVHDFQKIGEFLIRSCRLKDTCVNWLQPRWEYMHFHPLIRNVDLKSIGIWETCGKIVAACHPEHEMGTCYFQTDPDFEWLKSDMLAYAEIHFGIDQQGVRRLRLYIDDRDKDFIAEVSEKGYVKSGDCEPMLQLSISSLTPSAPLPPGFRLKSLAEENNLGKVDRVLWRGFNHPGEPPTGGERDRKFMQSAPNFQKNLNIVVESPGGQFGSYCGMWYEPVHEIAYVEPVATDPEYRRMGLGRAAVLEGIRRCGSLGARTAFVGSAQPFYKSMGFSQMYCHSSWLRER